MAANFNIVAKLTLQGPNNLNTIVNQIQSQLSSVKANVNLNVNAGTLNKLRNANRSIQAISASMVDFARNTRAAGIAVNNLANALASLNKVAQPINQASQAAANLQRRIQGAKNDMEQFGEEAAYSLRRFAAFAIPTAIFAGLSVAFKQGIQGAIDFEVEMIKLSQVTGRSVGALKDISDEITRLSTTLGVSSRELSEVSTTLAQAGLSAKDTKVALEALARSALAATFEDVKDTTEGVIAAMAQFKIEAKDVQGLIGSLNSVSAQFAVESDDLVSVIRRTGGAFQSAGGDLNELLGLFTSVRATTRESADSIATGFRTIFTRIQRPRTVGFLRELGVELQDVKGQFVGPVEAIRRLNAALADIPTTDSRFAAVIEELGGFRQVSKVIPLIQQFPEAIKAINVAQTGQISIIEDSEIAQKSLANQLTKLREEFFALFREIGQDKSFQEFLRTVIDVARNVIDLVKAVKPLAPLIASIGLVQFGGAASGFARGFVGGLTNPNPRRRFARGGVVPGSGNSDSVESLLMPGEFVLNKKSAQAIGYDKLGAANRFAGGSRNYIGKGTERNLEEFLVETDSLYQKNEDGTVSDKRVSRDRLLSKSKPFEFGLAALGPKPIEAQTYPSNVAFTKPVYDPIVKKNVPKSFVFPVNVTGSTVQDKELVEKIEEDVKTNIKVIARDIGKRFQEKFTIPIENDINDVEATKIIGKTNLESIVGGLFEASLFFTGAPFDKQAKSSNTANIDFPSGLGNAAKIFGNFPSSIPTDAKRSLDINDFVGSNLTSLFKREVENNSQELKGLVPKKDNVSVLASKESIKKETLASKPTFDQNTAIERALQRFNEGKEDGAGSRALSSTVNQYLKDLGLGNKGISFGTKGVAIQSGPLELLKQAINQKTEYEVENIAAAQAYKRKKLAEGGNISGVGTDTVPALLTPGEFVLNKKSAQAIGLQNLRAMNNVQKFAKGGVVKRFARGGAVGSNNSGNGNGALGFIALSSSLGTLIPLIEQLGGGIKETAKTFSAIAIGAGTLQFQLGALASETKLNRLSGLSFGAFSNVKTKTEGSTFARGLNGVSGTLARNFQALSLATGAAGSALSVLGDRFSKEADELTKKGDLAGATASKRSADSLAGAGLGVSIGAALGTAIAPGIGTAIGALLGGLAGAIVSGINSSNKEIVKAIEQQKFDKVQENIDSLVEGFQNNRFASKEIGASSIARAVASQRANIAGASDDETKGEFRKQFRNNLVNIRDAASTIANSSDSFDDFKNRFNKAGTDLFDAIVDITKDAEGTKAELEKQIEGQKKIRESAAAQKEADKQIKIVTASLSSFNNAVLDLSASIQASTQKFSTIESLIDFKPIDIGDIIPEGFFTRVAEGQINDPDLIRKNLNKLTAGSGLNQADLQSFQDQTVGVGILTNKLPGIIERVVASVGFSSNEDDAKDRLETELDQLKNVIPKSLRDLTLQLFDSQLQSRQNTGEGGVKVNARENIKQLLESLSPAALTAGIKEFDNSAKILTGTLNGLVQQIQNVNARELKLDETRNNILDRRFEFAQQLRVDGGSPTLNQVRNVSLAKETNLLKGTGFVGGFDPRAAGARLNTVNEQIKQQREVIRNTAPGSTENDKAVKTLENLTNQSNRLGAALKDVVSSASLLSKAQEDLSKATEDRKQGTALFDKLVTGSPDDIRDTEKNIFDIARLSAGDVKFADLNNKRRGEVFGAIDLLPQNKKSGIFGNRNAEEFKNFLRQQFIQDVGTKQGLPQAKIDELKTLITERSKEEAAAQAALKEIQDRAIKAQESLLQVEDQLVAELRILNSTTLKNLGVQLNNSIQQAQIGSLEAQKGIKGTELAENQGIKKSFENAASLLPKGFEGREAQVFQNAGLFQDILSNNSKIKTLKEEDIEKQKNIKKELQTIGGESLLKIGAFEKVNSIGLGFQSFITAARGLSAIGQGDKKIQKEQKEFFNKKGIKNVETFNDVLNLLNKSKDLTSQLKNPKENPEIKLLNEKNNENRQKLNQVNFNNNDIQQIIGNGPELINKFSEQFAALPKPLQEASANLEIFIKKIETISGDIKGLEKQIADRQALIKPEFKPAVPLEAALENVPPNLDIDVNIADFINNPEGAVDFTNVGNLDIDDALRNVRNNARLKKPQHLAYGGFVGGRGISSPLVKFAPKGADTIPAMLAKDEFVVNSKDALANADILEMINAGHMARGGRARTSGTGRKLNAYQQKLLEKNKEQKLFGKLSSKQYDLQKTRNIYLESRGLLADSTFRSRPKETVKNLSDFTLGLFSEDEVDKFLKQTNLKSGFKPQTKSFAEQKQESLHRQIAGQKAARAAKDDSLVRQSAGTARAKTARQKAQEAQSLKTVEAFGLGSNSLPSLPDKDTYVFENSNKLSDEIFDAVSLYESNVPLTIKDDFEERYEGSIKEGKKIASADYDRKFQEKGDEISRRVQEIIRASQEGTLGRKPLKFHEGGVVPGSGNKEVPALLLPGERVLPKSQAAAPLGLASQALAALGMFSESASSLSTVFSTFVGTADRLSEALTGFLNTKIEVTHSPITVAVNVAGMEGLESAIQEKVMAAVNATMASSKAKASDGKSPFFT